MQLQFQNNNELHHFLIMNIQDNRKNLEMKDSVFDTLFMYSHLKQLIINILAHDYSSLMTKQSLTKKYLVNEIRLN